MRGAHTKPGFYSGLLAVGGSPASASYILETGCSKPGSDSVVVNSGGRADNENSDMSFQNLAELNKIGHAPNQINNP